METSFPTLSDYKVIRQLGHGGMGVVYEAEQISLRRRVAVKVLKQTVGMPDTAVERFEREARAAARLRHSGIVEIYSVGAEGGIHYFSMELIPGASLESAIGAVRKGDSTPMLGAKSAELRRVSTVRTPVQTKEYVERVLKIIASVGDAVDYAHSQGIIHRDIKPANILLRDGLDPVLTDFGLAFDVDLPSLTRSGEIAGTPYYVSPEQIAARRVKIDHRTDIYSLGVTLYELLTLKRPFEGTTTQEVYEKISREEPIDPSRLNPVIHKDIVTIILRAMDKSPASRYARAADLSADLRAFLEHRPIRARRATVVERALKFAKREPARAALLGVLFVVVPSGVGTGVWILSKQKEIRDAGLITHAIRVDDLLSQGYFLLGEKQTAASRTVFEDVLRLDNTNIEAVAGIAFSYNTDQKPADALNILDQYRTLVEAQPVLKRVQAESLRTAGRIQELKAIESSLVKPTTPAEFFVSGSVEFARGESGDESAFTRSLSDLNRACLATGVTRPVYHFERARAARGARNASAQRESADVLAQKWPESAFAWFLIGFTLAEQSPDEAIAAYEKALRIDPKFPNAQINIGNILLRDGRWKDAEASARKAINTTPQVPFGHSQLGLALCRQGKTQEGLAELLKAVETSKDFKKADVYFNYGLELLESGNAAVALEQFKTATTLQPELVEPVMFVGNALLKMGKAKEAVEHLAASKSRFPQSGPFLVTFGRALREARDLAGAKLAFEEAVRVDPRFAEGHAQLAYMTLVAGDPGKAVVQAKSAVECNAKSELAHEVLMNAALSTGDMNTAHDEIERWTTLRPNDSASLNDFASILLEESLPAAKKNNVRALEVAKRAVEINKGANGNSLDTLASAYFANGDAALAAETQQRAVDWLTANPNPNDPGQIGRFKTRLKKYKNAAQTSSPGPGSKPSTSEK
ncbi:MAG: protein kinase domain-containing protein [Planctomycetota bacterium]